MKAVINVRGKVFHFHFSPFFAYYNTTCSAIRKSQFSLARSLVGRNLAEWLVLFGKILISTSTSGTKTAQPLFRYPE